MPVVHLISHWPADSLRGGAAVTVNLTFSNPNRAVISYTPQLFRGAL